MWAFQFKVKTCWYGTFGSHFGSRAISGSNVHGVFPVDERFWFCLVQVSTTQFCCSSLVLMARASDGTDVPVSPPLRIWVLLTALLLTSKEQDTAPVPWRRKSTKCSYKLRCSHYSYRADPGSKNASKRFPRQCLRMMRKSRILNKKS